MSTVWQPLPGSQKFAVQELSSSQSSGLPAQAPWSQVSPSVQALPSSQAAVLAAWTHPEEESQLSSVQGLPSMHCSVFPVQAPATHASARVHSSPSEQPTPSGAETMLHVPLAGSHLFFAHWVSPLASQVTAVLG